MAVLPHKVALSLTRPEVDNAFVPALGNQHSGEPGQPVGVQLDGELAGDFDLALMSQLQGDQFARPMADPMGDVVTRDVENLAIVGDASQDDVVVGMAGVVMVDRDPIEPGFQVLFHLTHEVPSEAAQVAHVGGILRSDDEAELVPVLPAPRQEGAPVRLVFRGRIGKALLAVASYAVPLQIAQVSVSCLAGVACHLRAARAALQVELQYPRLDDDPPRSEPPGGIPLPSGTLLGE